MEFQNPGASKWEENSESIWSSLTKDETEAQEKVSVGVGLHSKSEETLRPSFWSLPYTQSLYGELEENGRRQRRKYLSQNKDFLKNCF